MSTRRYVMAFVFAASAVAACGGGSGSSGPADPTRYGSPASGDPIAGTSAWDEHGKEIHCNLPEPHCGDEKRPSADFQDECSLKGFRMIKCGCEMYCTGNISGPKRAYTAKNVEKDCAPPKDDCTPPDTSAAFQDACTDAGNKFVVCGCEWLCSGKLRQSVSDTPPPEEDEATPDKDSDKSSDKDSDKDKKKPAPKKK